MVKKCCRCKQEKLLENFSKYKKGKDGYSITCKQCRKEYNDQNKELIKEQDKKRYLKNPDKFKQRTIEYNRINPQKSKEYYQKNREREIKRGIEYKRKKYKTDPLFRLEAILRARLLDYVYRDSKSASAKELLGCTLQEFKNFIEKQFLPEMNWSNHGKIWEIDHIKPCNSFNLLDPKQQKECYHYLNMQPLFSTTKIAENLGYVNYIGNRDKGDKIL